MLFVPQVLRSASTDSELPASTTLARCLLFDSHVGHILFPAWADTRTAIFRALGYTEVIASAPTPTHTSCYNKKYSEIPAATARIHGLKPVVLHLYQL